VILTFPNLDVLRLSLTSGAVPPAVSRTSAIAGLGEQEQIWVEPSVTLSRSAQNDLRRLGVQVAKTGGPLTFEVSCWPELLPLRPDPLPLNELGQTPVLFDLARGDQLARLVTEILRLGNDRQGFRWLEAADKNDAGRALLRVVGPPYYSLLQALDRDGATDAPHAFSERTPGVWVELGYAHPLTEQIKPPAGKILLLRPPRHWTFLDEGPFRDVYEVIEFTLPDAPAAWRESELPERIRVAPRLAAGGAGDVAELWVLRSNALEELNRFVQASDDQLLHRLAFAVGERDGRQVVAVRVRPSKLPPPALVLPAEAYRTHLKLPNLFLPCGTRLKPPLRRDVVRRLFAEDLDKITWLAPGPDETFTPESLPESAFRPLPDWVEYVLDHDKEELQAWVQVAQFDFEAFVCTDEAPAKPKRPPSSDKKRSEKGLKRATDGGLETPEPVAFPVVKKGKKPAAAEELPDLMGTALPEPSEAQKRLHELEERFLAVTDSLDAPERQALWPEMAGLNAALDNGSDAGLCWLHALWDKDEAPAAWAWSWFRAEASAVPIRPEKGLPRGFSWVARVTSAAPGARELSGVELDRLLTFTPPTVADVRALAAYVVWAGSQKSPPTSLRERLSAIQGFLEAREAVLPARAAWLAWTAVTQLSGGDVLALTRARDRLLERLYQKGLRPELDLPSFLRFSGPRSGSRIKAIGNWLAGLCEAAQEWLRTFGRPLVHAPKTEGYVDLLFAFGLARLGEVDACQAYLERAKLVLAEDLDVHSFLLESYSYRIRQVLDGKPHGGPLPAEQMEYLQKILSSEAQYAVDRLRHSSRILEPDQKVQPYRNTLKGSNELEGAMARLPDVLDRAELAVQINALLARVPKGAKSARLFARVLRLALDQAPRAGEEFSLGLLGKVVPAFAELPEPQDLFELQDDAALLEKALFVAAHFDQAEYVQALLSHFRRLLQRQRGPNGLQGLDALAGQCFRSLRKLGLHDAINDLLRTISDQLLEGRPLAALDPVELAGSVAGLRVLRVLLHVAAQWYYIGRDKEAEEAINLARAVLLRKPPKSEKDLSISTPIEVPERAELARAYVTSLGHAPREATQARLEELFKKLEGIRDAYTTNKYYGRLQLEVVEAVVLAVVSEDFTLGVTARRWLDEDEFLIRRRVHRDVRAALG
jgi:cellulose synthase operon protein C